MSLRNSVIAVVCLDQVLKFRLRSGRKQCIGLDGLGAEHQLAEDVLVVTSEYPFSKVAGIGLRGGDHSRGLDNWLGRDKQILLRIHRLLLFQKAGETW